MTTDTKGTELRTDVLEKIVALMQNWNGSAEEAMEIIAENQQNLDQLQAIEKQLSEEEAFHYTPVERNLLTVIIPQQQKMMAVIRKERSRLLDKINQVNKKNQVRDNYVGMQRAPMFIDKGI